MHQLVHFLHQFMVEIKEIEINSAQRSGTLRLLVATPRFSVAPFGPLTKTSAGAPGEMTTQHVKQ